MVPRVMTMRPTERATRGQAAAQAPTGTIRTDVLRVSIKGRPRFRMQGQHAPSRPPTAGAATGFLACLPAAMHGCFQHSGP
jgi:hypothetical protein